MKESRIKIEKNQKKVRFIYENSIWHDNILEKLLPKRNKIRIESLFSKHLYIRYHLFDLVQHDLKALCNKVRDQIDNLFASK